VAESAQKLPQMLETWHAEHVHFNRLLDALQRQIDVFHAGERPNYELMLGILSYLREYPDQYHHRLEDVAFERLAQRCPDLRPDLDRLRQEHRVIAQAGEALRDDLEAILHGAILKRGEVEVAAATYLVYYGNHIAKEEEDVLPRAVQVFTPQDWEAVRAAVPSDGAAQGQQDERYRALMRLETTGG
jgi:hemerythrin-like domain-containing protein